MPYTHCQGYALNLAVKGACFKGTVMQTEKSLINDRLRISKIAMNAKSLVFLFVLNRSYISYYINCQTVPLK